MVTKKTALNTHWTPTNSPQLTHQISEMISPETEIDSLEHFGHFLFKYYVAQLFATGCFGPVPASHFTPKPTARESSIGRNPAAQYHPASARKITSE